MLILTRCTFQRNAPTSPWSQWKLEKFGSLPKNFSTFRRSSLRHHETLELMTGNDVQLGTKQFSNPTNALTLQSISTFCTGIKQGQYEVLVCRKWLKERERHIPDITLIKSLAFGQVKPNGALNPKHHILWISCCVLTPLYLFIILLFWPEINPESKHFSPNFCWYTLKNNFYVWMDISKQKKKIEAGNFPSQFNEVHVKIILPITEIWILFSIGSDNSQPYFWP